jgi:hypothetical protein
MSKKALYRHKKSGDLFAIETDETGKVISTSGPLLSKDLNPEALDYDNYWNPDIKANINGFELLPEAEYKELLKKTGFFIQQSQRSIFSELERHKKELKNQKGPVIRIKEKIFSLPDSQTGKFCVTKSELQSIILLLLRQNKSGRCGQKRLFTKLLSHMQIRASGESHKELLKIYLENLRELRDANKIEFISGKTRLNIRLAKS